MYHIFRYLFFFIVLLNLVFTGQAQQHDQVWLFGYESDLTTNGIEGVQIDFGISPPSITSVALAGSLHQSSSSISSESGELLFYTNGCSIFDANHQLLQNGDSINPGFIHEEYCDLGYIGGNQGTLILPTGNSKIFFLFHKKVDLVNSNPVTEGLYYTKVDLSLNNNQGGVTNKNVPLIQENITYGQITATKHANGEDWWIVTGGDQNNKYYIFLLTATGEIQGPTIQSIGLPSSYNGSRGGQAGFSPDGNKYVRFSAPDGSYLFDFDRELGLLSNFLHLEINDGAFSGGAVVSPNSRFLYICSDEYVYQFDLQADDIVASRVTVAEYDGYQSPFPTMFYSGQLAPDCKIYINSFATVDVLHVIHEPDQPGLACDLEQHAVQLPHNHLRSLPHFPNYRLGPLVHGEPAAPPCEPVTSAEEVEVATNAFRVFPNPASDHLTISGARPFPEGFRFFLHNALGQIVRSDRLNKGQLQQRIELKTLPAGWYFYRLTQGKEVYDSGKVIIER